MNQIQRQAAFDYAVINYDKAEVQLDADIENAAGFDEVDDGVWVHAWIKVPKEAIPGYAMTPPAPPATVKYQAPRGAWPFPTMSHPHLNTDSDN